MQGYIVQRQGFGNDVACTAAQVRELFAGQPVRNLRMGFAIFAPGGEWMARRLESIMSACVPFGALLAVMADVT